MDAEVLDARWRAHLESWAIPAEIRAAAPVDPWGHDPTRFVVRTDQAMAAPGPTIHRLGEVLPGTVLDVGSGAGAASLPLRGLITAITAVDVSPEMLTEFVARADKLGISAETVEGRWPDVAGEVPQADVAVAAHVVYNVPGLADFLRALHAHARRRVVIELTHRHPLSWLSRLWSHYHGSERPVRPIAEDVVALAAALGYPVRVEEREAPISRFSDIEELAASACHRLCLSPERAGEVAGTAMELGMWPVPRDRWVTVWWDVR
ncbi:class I SAM-dependent methyltransferase [Nonomuraea sp. NPDC050310]|uniref:class I SAM-dependent methyltransferase n=1 Tax=unclassified Nonomuraea TaxID=2593643 RepID=UPI0033DB7EA6